MRHGALTLLTTLLSSAVSSGQTWDRENIAFADIEKIALDISTKEYQATDPQMLPDWMKRLSYDQYRDIRFKPDQALWTEPNLPFRAMFFHPGYRFQEPVQLTEFTDTHKQEIRLAEGFFDYGSLVGERGEMPPDAGFGGLRLHAPLHQPNVFDELIVFQGASYWRALGKDQVYGLTSRALAIDTGSEGSVEEFPRFKEFWLHKPHPGDTTALMYGLLDSPSYAGAFAFLIQPGADTVVDVRAVIFPRKAVKRLGLAPLSSMFWFGENSRRRFDDYRPEVHDSDGLMIRTGSGENIWRPLSNETGKAEFSFFAMEKLSGFGLLQRDRRFESYEDDESKYHQRPSVWIEPTSDWGTGRVMLMENPTDKELDTNVVVFWEPGRIPQPGEKVEFRYRQTWTLNPDPAGSGGRVVATRTGVHDWMPDKRTMLVEFTGGALDKWEGDSPQALVEVTGDGAEKVDIRDVTVQRLPNGHWRVGFQLGPKGEGKTLQEVGPVELRCSLKHGEDFLTETWAYRITP